jgi:4'-phosphopantetheinyl transferase EntD
VEQLPALFPPSASLAIADLAMQPNLWPEEEIHLAHAVPKRRREFSLGRAAARAALAKLDVAALAIPANTDRTPVWPAGFTGSITHCDGFCGAVVARSHDLESIGFDAETADPLPADTRRIIYGVEEAAHFSTLPAIAGLDWPKLAFSAKEAFYKCFYPVTRRPLNFRDVNVRFAVSGSQAGSFDIIPVASGTTAFLRRDARGRWQMQDGLLFTSFVLMPDGSGPATSGAPR